MCVTVTQTHLCDVFLTLDMDIPALIICVCLQVLPTYLQTEIDLFVFLIPIHSSKNNGGGVWLGFFTYEDQVRCTIPKQYM